MPTETSSIEVIEFEDLFVWIRSETSSHPLSHCRELPTNIPPLYVNSLKLLRARLYAVTCNDHDHQVLCRSPHTCRDLPLAKEHCALNRLGKGRG